MQGKVLSSHTFIFLESKEEVRRLILVVIGIGTSIIEQDQYYISKKYPGCDFFD